MKNILCFGDSNTYGLKPDGTGRYDFTVRYPGRLQALLGSGYRIIEEGCPGRTTIFEDIKRPYKKGLDYIVPCLLSHNPLDFVIVMLGTNDCKTIFKASCTDIVCGLQNIIDKIKANTDSSTKILLISPIHLGDNIGKPGYDPEFNEDSIMLSKKLADGYNRTAILSGCYFFDASSVASPSPVDEEHLDEIGHACLAESVLNIILANTQITINIPPMANPYKSEPDQSISPLIFL